MGGTGSFTVTFHRYLGDVCTASSRFMSSCQFRLCSKTGRPDLDDGYPFSQAATFSLLRVHLQARIASFCMLAPTTSRNRFTSAKLHQLPVASFRPSRYQDRPCESDSLPRERGEVGGKTPAGFASFAGQTKSCSFTEATAFQFNGDSPQRYASPTAAYQKKTK